MIFTDEDVTEALSHACELCKAPQGQPCINICDGTALPDRTVHFYRIKTVFQHIETTGKKPK